MQTFKNNRDWLHFRDLLLRCHPLSITWCRPTSWSFYCAKQFYHPISTKLGTRHPVIVISESQRPLTYYMLYMICPMLLESRQKHFS